MNVLFLDACCPKPYSTEVLRVAALGGAEASVVRVADALGAYVCQHNRQLSEGRYLSPADASRMSFECIVSLRIAKTIGTAERLWPGARHVLWLHDLSTAHLLEGGRFLAALRPEVICVSDFHLAHVSGKLEAAGSRAVRTLRIYNPLADDLAPNASHVDPNKLIFLSSPHKGLEHALLMFEHLQNAVPEMRLYVANPGYRPDAVSDIPGVVNLGPQPHAHAIRHVRESLCVFYPNLVFRETFGLVFAEANAVGTPVLAHDFGAAAEVLGTKDQVMDARDYKGFVGRVLEWRNGKRPVVRPNPLFRLSTVAQDWRELLAGAR